jgi:intermediate peptidase
MSDSICLVMDAAELCRSTHPDTAWKRGAMAAYESLAQLVARLNMDTRLYKALVACIERASSASCSKEDGLDDEQMRVAQLLRTDFERGGVHLDSAGQEQVLALQEQIGHLCFEFVDAPSTAGAPHALSLFSKVPHST